MFPGPDAPREAGATSFRRMILGGLVPDWDVETEIVLAEPFMSYVVHDAVVMSGEAHRLPDMLRRWSAFLTDGYDTFGENWGTGTRVHGWSSTPARDLVTAILGISPALPGFAAALVAPRLGSIAWAEGAAPCPQGIIRVKARDGRLMIESPVPVQVDLPGREMQTFEAGSIEIELN